MPCISDFVSGALNKLKYNRTPSITPQQERISKCYMYLMKISELFWFNQIQYFQWRYYTIILYCDLLITLDIINPKL